MSNHRTTSLMFLSWFLLSICGLSAQRDSLRLLLPENKDGRVALAIAESYPRGELDSTMHYLELAIKQSTAAGVDTILGAAYIKKSWLFVTPLHQFDSTEYYARLGLSYLDTSLVSTAVIRGYNQLGIAAVQLGRLEEGLSNFKKTADLRLRQDNQCGYATALHNMAKVYKYIGEESRADRYFTESLHTKEAEHCDDNYSFIYFNIAAMHEDKGAVDSTIYYVTKTLQKDKEHGSTDHMAPANYLLGKMYLLKAQPDTAIAYLRKGQTIAEQTHNRAIKKYVRYELAKYHYLKLAYDSSMYYLDLAEQLPMVAPDLNMTIDSLGYEVAKSKGNYREALAKYERFKLKADSLDKRKVIAQLENFQSQRKDDEIELLKREQTVSELQVRQSRLYAGLAFLVGLVGVLFLIYRNRRNRSNAQLQLLKVEAENNLAYQRLLNRTLRAQMNPHFIFNTLNSIKHFALFKSKEETGDYITDFSGLIRQILDSSDHRLISLRQEFDLLEQYVTIEQRRVREGFRFTVDIEDHAQIDDCDIPPLLLQPYVENAIWHGLMPKEGDRLLQVKVLSTEGGFVVKIIDNGIGRMASGMQQTLDRESKGTSLTAQRLENLNKLSGSNYTVEIIDLLDKAGSPAGTEVRVSLSLVTDH